TLLEAGADPSCATPTGITPLIAAVNMQQLPLLPLLLEHGADIDQRLPGGVSALMVASAEGHVDVVARLLSAHADPHARDDKQLTWLQAAAQYAFASHDSLR